MAQETGVQKVETVKGELPTRHFTGYVRVVVSAIAVAMALFQMYIAYTIPVTLTLQIHLTFGLVLVFLYYPSYKNQEGIRWYDILLVVMAIVFNARYFFLGVRGFLPEQLADFSPFDRVMAIMAIIAILEATRRTTGLPLVIVTIGFIAYVFLGPWVPGLLQHPGASLDRLLTKVYVSTQGIYGLALDASATQIFMLVLFGGFLLAMGGGQAFIDLASALMGHVRGGPAKIAIVASALFGTISGSVIANVATTGAFTIPMMKRIGYAPHFAGAVEATASKGGQIMPPVMGAAAFIMAELLGIGYNKIIIAAALPAILYFFAIFMGVDLEAARTGLKGLPREELPSVKSVIKSSWYLVASPAVLIYLMVGPQWSPQRAALFAIVAMLVVDVIQQVLTTKSYDWGRVLRAIESGTKSAITITVITGAIGLIIGVIDLTGIGISFTTFLVTLAEGNLLTLLIIAAITSIILGMGLPTTICYILLAVMAAPAIVRLSADVLPGIPEETRALAAHLFVFYYGLVANITPPVALAAYVAAGIAKASPMRTAFTACRIGWASYVLPFMFMYNPVLLLRGPVPEIILAAITATIGIVFFTAGSEGWLLGRANIIQRLLWLGGSLFLVHPGLQTDIIGIVIVGSAFLWHWIGTRRAIKAERIAVGSPADPVSEPRIAEGGER